jgi:hypothetical protein
MAGITSLDPTESQLNFFIEVFKNIPCAKQVNDCEENGVWEVGGIFYIDLWNDGLSFWEDIGDEGFIDYTFEEWIDRLPKEAQAQFLFHLDVFTNHEEITKKLR